ncbi:transglycosylase domain-containing protein [Dactylosporangium sp. CA-052675]|uniref:transglycosylase domain-containing protein n=1 Tax=Dactylosporangium sp. CA-052675 TaxID=3239927 RepID=UPI003D923E64
MQRRRVLAGAAIVVVLLAGAAAAAGIYTGSVTVPPLPEPGGSTEILYSDGTLMARTGKDDQVPIDTARLPQYVPEAVIAAQDPGFRDGHWFGRPTELSVRYTRKVLDDPGVGTARLLAVASRLERQYGRDVILDRYLNTAYFGRLAYGIEAAAQAYYDKPAATLSPGEAVVLAAQLDSPGDGAYDPTVHADAARRRFEEIRGRMSGGGAAVVFPEGTTRTADDATKRHRALRPDGSDGLVEQRVLDEFATLGLNAAGARISTTIDRRLQGSLLGAVGAAMSGQPTTLAAGAVAVQPLTGRILAYYGNDRAAATDYAGAHPPGNAFAPITVAAALKAGISLQSRWQAPAEMDFPASGRTAKGGNPVRDVHRCPGGKASCTLLEAQRDGLRVPLFGVTEKVGAAKVLDMARALGAGTIWATVDGKAVAIRLDGPGDALSPRYFNTEVGYGQYPMTLSDQANVMATLAGDGKRARAHLIAAVTSGSRTTYRATELAEAGVDEAIARNVAWSLAQQPAGRLADGRQTSLAIGDWPLDGDLSKTAHATAAGFAPQVAVAVWVGNRAEERPLLDRSGAPVTGATLPAAVYRQFMGAALGTARSDIQQPVLLGDPKAGNA